MDINVNQSGKLEAEFKPANSTGHYIVMIINGSDRDKLSTDNADQIQPLAKLDGTGPLKMGPVNVGAGTYSVLALTTEKEKMRVHYRITGRE